MVANEFREELSVMGGLAEITPLDGGLREAASPLSEHLLERRFVDSVPLKVHGRTLAEPAKFAGRTPSSQSPSSTSCHPAPKNKYLLAVGRAVTCSPPVPDPQVRGEPDLELALLTAGVPNASPRSATADSPLPSALVLRRDLSQVVIRAVVGANRCNYFGQPLHTSEPAPATGWPARPSVRFYRDRSCRKAETPRPRRHPRDTP